MSRGKPWRSSDAAHQRWAARAAHLRATRHDRNREKNWKHVYLRSNKLARARQLGFDYPRKHVRDVIDEHTGDRPEDGAS